MKIRDFIITMVIAVCATAGGAVPLAIQAKSTNDQLNALKRSERIYEFDVDGHFIATLTSEVQEHTHDMYLAHCIREANETYIEVPVNDQSLKLNLIYTGYNITYTLGSGITSKKVSNQGWALYEL